MIRRTILEWKSIPYGEGDDAIPDWAADRIVAVARRSELGGEGGARVLTHGRTELRAAQVVGVIAAQDCALEILPKIDFGSDGEIKVGLIRRQLIHMLAAALDVEVDTGAVTELGWQKENLLEILIGLFARKLSDALRRGLPRRYVGAEEDLPVLRGRMNLTRQVTSLACSPHILACRYDALSPDTALNQIMKAAARRLLRLSCVSENQRRLREIDFIYADITDVPVRSLRWHEVVIDRTNMAWRELLGLAKLLLGERFQSTSIGSTMGFALLFEMNTLFERFIARMLQRALAGGSKTIHAQGGRLHCLESIPDSRRLFMTKPDILVMSNGANELVIDTKWKQLRTLSEDPKQGVSQADVYQMMAYGRVYQCGRLLLLYPHHAGLSGKDSHTAHHRIVGGGEVLSMATIDVSGGSRLVVDSLRALVDDLVSRGRGNEALAREQ